MIPRIPRQSRKHEVDVVESVELTEERGRRNRNGVFEISDFFNFSAVRAFGVMWADSDALSAVDTALGQDPRLASVNAYRLRRASLQTVGAAAALIGIELN